MSIKINHKICLAPMLDYTNRHFRYLIRLMSRHAFLYTEMVTTGAILFGETNRYLKFNEVEHPVAIQLGGNDPSALAKCAKIAEQYGYDEINFNVGCPSARVQKGTFGACLFLEPQLVADCVSAMTEAVDIPVTVKTRIGVDEHDTFDELCQFVDLVSSRGSRAFIIHARKAFLKKYSPKENRLKSELNYQWVYQIKKEFPKLEIILNGGIKSLEEIQTHLLHVDGAMIGQAAYKNPAMFLSVNSAIFNSPEEPLTQREVIKQYLQYVDKELIKGVPVSLLLKNLLGFMKSEKGALAWRQLINQLITEKVSNPCDKIRKFLG